ncbi:MAG: hypothetical protein KME05_04140 [Gloeocapsa sp. UFS-A4-WI-NPMV-4B04]|jgi:molecular chaperone DnaK (HSP70)|nr:hypothetical protein [Gloeocapsa sp. UFS-A4-WI-NPMV-4B04]
MHILEIIGFDLGHGETAVAKAKVESIEPPEMLEINNKKVQITALGKHPDLGYLVGEQALIQAGVTQLKISFKQKPNHDLNYRQTIRSFLETYYHLLKESKQISGGVDSHFYIGCPSGWSISDRQEYQKLLKECGIPRLSVVPESRAAFMQAKEVGKFDYETLKSSVLIVDIGSSTTDFTLVKSFQEIPKDFGINALGSALIDRAIFARTLTSHEQKDLLEKVFAEYPHHQARCELACRKAKEDYFSNEQLYSDPQSFARGFESINEQIYFIPKVNRLMMEEILHQPLPELEQKSWIECFRLAVNEAKEKLDQQGIVPKVILMTGGASRMKFTRLICEEYFPEPETQVRPDPEPERCIALGLARVGRWDLRATEFKQEVNTLCNSKELKDLIEKHIPDLIQLLIEPLSQGLIENIVQPSLKDWRNNKIRTLADLENDIKTKAEQWLKSDRTQQLINTQCLTWFNSKIQPELAQATDPICRKFQVPRSSLRFEDGIDSAEVNPELPIGDTILADTVAFVVSVVIGGGAIGSIIALLLTGHLILPIALVYGAAFLGEGVRLNRDKIQDAIKTNLDIPSWIRYVALGDKTIEDICNKINPELKSSLRETMIHKRDVFEELIEKIGYQVKKTLDIKVEEVTILIQ